MRRVLGFLRRHPLVWIIPLATYAFLIGYVAVKLARAPETEFIYDV